MVLNAVGIDCSLVTAGDKGDLRPVLRSWINLSRISLRYLGWLNQIFAVQDKRYYEAGYQLGKSTQGFPIWISARSHKGEVFSQHLTNHKHAETLQSRLLYHGGADNYSSTIWRIQTHHPGQKQQLPHCATRILFKIYILVNFYN